LLVGDKVKKLNYKQVLRFHLQNAIKKARQKKKEEKKYIADFKADCKLSDRLLPNRDLLIRSTINRLDVEHWNAEDEKRKDLDK
jgi:hypothetical protein